MTNSSHCQQQKAKLLNSWDLYEVLRLVAFKKLLICQKTLLGSVGRG